jgi:hypothetical protein
MREMKKGLLGVFAAALAWGAIFTGLLGTAATPTQGATLGDPLQNQDLKGTTGSATLNGKAWSMYSIPGLNRFRKPNEGSFVQWGYKGWSGAPTGMPLSQSSTPSTNQTDWKNGTTASPSSISFQKPGSETSGDGKAFFALNYVDSARLVDFGRGNDASTIATAWAKHSTTSDQNKEIFNTFGVNSKMDSSLHLADGESYSGGYIQATGNVPIKIAIASNSPTAVDALMAGDWSVMVGVKVAKGIDAKALAASINWSTSFYYLTVDAVSLPGYSLKFNFPMQFDHHVYLDPNNPQRIFLKVKGVPFNVIDQDQYYSTTAYARKLQLQNGNADYVDYLNNRELNEQTKLTAYFLDFLGGVNTQSRSAGTMTPNEGAADFPEISTQTPTGTAINEQAAGWQPRFSAQEGNQTSSSDLSWDALGGLLGNKYGSQPSSSSAQLSPVYNLGPTGRMVTMMNEAADPVPSWRSVDTGISGSVFRLLLRSFMGNGTFTGSAHINFTFDMSKYSAGTTAEEQAITKGRLPAAPNADGTFNDPNDPLSATNAVQIRMYDSNNLVDPYSTTKGLDRSNATDQNSALRQALHVSPWSTSNRGQNGQSTAVGETPADYAVINATSEDQLDTMGTNYPVYTNFTSWTGAIVPYDRMHWTDETSGNQQDTTYTDTMHTEGKLGNDIDDRTASPDPGLDGILVSSGKDAFRVQDRDTYLNETNGFGGKANLPIFAKDKLTTAGLIWPERYANVYQFYDYNSSGQETAVNIKPVDYAAKDAEIAVASPSNLTNKTITSNLDGDTWQYTGTLDGAPLADATVKLKQVLSPKLNLNLTPLFFVYENQVEKGNHFNEPLGSWRDTLASAGTGAGASDSMNLNFTPAASGSSPSQNITVSGLAATTTDQPIRGDWSASNALASAGSTTPTATGITAHYMLPTETPPSNIYFKGSGTVTRSGAIKCQNNYQLKDGVDATATSNYALFLVLGPDTTPGYTARKEFTTTNGVSTGTIHPLTGKAETVPVKVAVTRVSTAPTDDDSQMVICIPKVTGLTTDTPVVKDSSGNTVTATPVSDSLSSLYSAYTVDFGDTPKSFTYTYNCQITDSSSPLVPLNTPFADLIMNTADTANQQVLAVSNGVQFTQMQNVNLLHAPSLDFKKQSLPSSGAGTYDLPDPSEADDAYFQVQDNTNNTHSWSLKGQLSPFVNDQNAAYKNFILNLGQPMLSLADDPEPNSTKPTDTTDTGKATYTSSEWNYVNHTPAPMVSDLTSTNLYTLNRFYETDADASNLKRYYPFATLITPADMNPQITAGKYSASITYTMQDDGSL